MVVPVYMGLVGIVWRRALQRIQNIARVERMGRSCLGTGMGSAQGDAQRRLLDRRSDPDDLRALLPGAVAP